ncbi:MAG: FAD-dependent monooxygenase [Sphingomonadales bacterium]
MQRTEILVVGAGPVGTVAAYRLARMGIDVVLCEAADSCAHDLRASTIHAPTIEMLDELGVADELIERGLKAPVYQMRDRRSGNIIAFDMAEIADRTRYPYRLQCEQYYMAMAIAERLRNHPRAEVLFGTPVLSVSQNGNEAIATVEHKGEKREIAARFIIGADGARSVVRKSLGVEFEGFTYEEKFLSLSTDFPIEDVITDLAYVNYISDPDEWLVLLRVPSLWRILVPASNAESDESLLSGQNVASVMGRIVGDRPVNVSHRTIYRVHQRVASTFVDDRILLIGDAAHLNNPLGGFGMNSGIHDAWNLTEKLEAILRRGGGPELLERFNRQRRAVTKSFIQAQTIENKVFMEQGMADYQKERLARFEAIHNDPEQRRAYLLRQSMFASLEEAEAIQ